MTILSDNLQWKKITVIKLLYYVYHLIYFLFQNFFSKTGLDRERTKQLKHMWAFQYHTFLKNEKYLTLNVCKLMLMKEIKKETKEREI